MPYLATYLALILGYLGQDLAQDPRLWPPNSCLSAFFGKIPAFLVKIPDILYLPSEPHIPKEPEVWARKAEEILKPIFGIKGFSMLMKFITIHHVPIDYLHAILQGITKQFLECWINSEYSDHRFYLGNNIADIDAYLLNIKPLHEFRSTPRPIRKGLFYWKS